MASSYGRDTAPAGKDPAATAMRTARKNITHSFSDVPPAGAVASVLDLSCQIWKDMDQAKLQILLRLAQIHATGNLLEVGGQRTLAGWITHSLRVPQSEARSLAALAHLLFEEKIPETRKALDEEMLSVGEATAVAKAVEQAVKTRNRTKHEDADLFRQMMDAGLVAAKANDPTLSSKELLQAGRDIAAGLNPTLLEDQYKKAYDNRRADLARTFGGSYYLQAWGPDIDAELIGKALAAFTKPHDPNKPQVSKAERTYDGFVAMIKAALGHQECTKPPGPLAMINITVPMDVFTGERQANVAREAGPAPQSADAPRRSGFAATQDGQVLAMAAVRNMAEDSILRRVITDPTTGKPLDVGRGQRNAPEQIRTVANHGHTTCAWDQGCDVPISDTEADHIHSYSRGGKTSADNIQPLCSTHNRLKWRREANPHRAVWKGRPTHRKPDPPPDPEPP